MFLLWFFVDILSNPFVLVTKKRTRKVLRFCGFAEELEKPYLLSAGQPLAE